MGTDNIDWKNTGIGAAQVVLGVAKAAIGVTGGPAAASGVDGAVGGLDKVLGGVGVDDVRLSQTAPAQPTPQAPPATTPPPQPVTPVATAPIVPPQAPPIVPPQTQPSRLERFERDGRPLPSPAPPSAPTAEDQERTKLLRALSTRGWTNDEAQIIERGRSTESLRLIGPIVEDSEVRVSAVPIEKVTAQLVKEVPGQVKVSGGSPPWLLAFSRLWLLPPSEKLVLEDRLLSGISDSDPQLLTAREQLPEYVTLARTSAVPPAELQRDVGRLPTDQLWLLRAAVAGSKQTGGN